VRREEKLIGGVRCKREGDPIYQTGKKGADSQGLRTAKPEVQVTKIKSKRPRQTARESGTPGLRNLSSSGAGKGSAGAGNLDEFGKKD